MSLITREMAAQNGKTNGDSKQSDDRLLLERAGSTQLAQRKGSFNNNGDELSRDYNAPPSSYSVPKQHGGLDKSANGLADFFSTEVFQIVLHNPTTAHRLLKFSQARMCGENMEFLEKVDRYNALLDELTTIMTDIHYSYTATEAPKQLGIHVNLMRRMNADIKASTMSTLPSMESIFTEAQDNVENILRTAVYPRFVKYQMTNSASKALSTDRTKYQGLGDCFCLTDPNKADNPIVFASDGFVSVTGYSRPEVVPRNCRFLQGNYTDRTATKRLKASIEAREETVELLLNYKKTGEPFWNLLYVAPLFDAEGDLKFFIGGQINCSTTIRSNTDVLKILSMSDDLEDDKEAAQSVRSIKPTKRSFFRFSRKESIPQLPSSTKRVEVRGDGMEQGLLKQIEKMNFRTQMEVFYTAYSKVRLFYLLHIPVPSINMSQYLVVKYDSFAISHYSLGIVDILGITNQSSHDFVGSNIFKFLAQHTTALPREYKSKVKDALKHGQAISASINLFTLRSLAHSKGDDKFFTHWTPCKDERGFVAYVVVTLSSTLYE
ncbi:MAG: hypothetical protein ALECFALPRED_004642 [Alectoria fallacina]|uniref:RGS domain-containing protein n=1 Tax=Alectoria fallacina TaxID=1903189 RepID=A0A8H3IW33_9LECA|nr:MAG: hypothetical protein ALECFALPRED_004642 [Alectoria fallacina]